MDLTPVPIGNDVQANTTTASDQKFASVTALSDGGFVVTWASLGQDGDNYGIYAQRYSASAVPIGGEFQVNTTTASIQLYPDVIGLADGGYLITWSSFGGQDGDGWGVYGQRYTVSGAPSGAEFRINTTTVSDQLYQSAVALPDGGFTVSWTSFGQDGSGYAIVQRSFPGLGAPTAEVRIGTTTTGDQFLTDLAVLSNGQTVAVWESAADGSGFGIYASIGGGAEFKVNTTTLGDQRSPSIIGVNDGFVVTWSSDGQDGSGKGIYGQLYNASGIAIGVEFRVNTTTAGDQLYPSTAKLDDGGFVVMWSSNGQDGSGYGLYGQRYTANGLPVGTEFLINQTTAGDQLADGFDGTPTLATLPGGRLVATWAGQGPEEVYVRIIDVPLDPTPPTPVAVGNSFLVDTSSRPTDGAVAALTDGSFVVVWTQFGPFDKVVGRRFNSDGTPNGSLFAISSDSGHSDDHAAVIALADGGFYVTWTQDGPQARAYGRQFDASGVGQTAQPLSLPGSGTVAAQLDDQKIVAVWSAGEISGAIKPNGGSFGTTFQINTTTTDTQYNPSIAALADGGFVVTWSSANQDGSGYGIYGQRLTSAGVLNGTEFRVNTSTAGDQQFSSVIRLGSGFLVTWSSNGTDGDGYGIYGQRYDANGIAVGGEVHISTTTTGDQKFSSATVLDDGGFLVVWSSNLQDGSGYGVYGQRFTSSGDAAGAEFRLNNVTSGDQLGDSAGGSEFVATLADGRVVVTYLSGTNQVAARFFEAAALSLPPTDIALSASAVNEFAANGTLVGSLSATDPDSSNLHFVLLDTAGGRFDIGADGKSIVVADGLSLDFEQQESHTVKVRVYDDTGASFDESFSISVGNINPESITGDGRANHFVGGAKVDTFDGGGGDDILDGGAAKDHLTGGDGSDTYIVDNAGDVLTETNASAAGGVDLVQSSVNWALGANFENLTLVGTAAKGTGNGLDNVIRGNAKNNTLDGGVGADTMFGGAGNDVYYADNSGDIAREDSTLGVDDGGVDYVYSSATFALGMFLENLTLNGAGAVDGTGNDLDNKINGNDAVNHLYGGGGSDILKGKGGADYLDGGEGDDYYYIDRTDTITDTGTTGTDTVLAGNATTTLTTGDGIENLSASPTSTGDINLTGNEENNRIQGNLGNNYIRGFDGNDFITAGAGNDTLVGGAGKDTLLGGDGADTFLFKANDSPVTSSLYDTINDFVSGTDKIDLDIVGAGGLAASAFAQTSITSNSYNAALAAAQSAMGDALHKAVFVAGTTDGWLFWNNDSNATTADAAVRILGGHALTAVQRTDII